MRKLSKDLFDVLVLIIYINIYFITYESNYCSDTMSVEVSCVCLLNLYNNYL